ncbi:hypothetical protein C8R44DRAFT_623689 [Mycena epipterygia]|nr:hypothetical protein C8R44DRAFT_623689 [Mycena epipterygia]
MALEHLRSEMLAWEDALSANDSGDFRGSLRLFQPIASTSKIFVNTALIHDRLGERPEAIESFTKAIELDEYLAIGYFQRGVSYFHGERYPEAAKDFSDAETMMRTNPYIDYKPVGLDYRLELTEVLFNKWLALSKMGQTESAMVFQKLIETSPSPELRAVIENAMKNSEERCTPCSLVSRNIPLIQNIIDSSFFF